MSHDQYVTLWQAAVVPLLVLALAGAAWLLFGKRR